MEITIERILPGGLGLAHAEGKTVMVALAAKGDRLRVHIDRVKGNVAFASIEEILERSPERVEPPCPYFGRCGGCDFQQMNYDAQLRAKKEIIRDCLHRIGGMTEVADFEIVAGPNQWHYRSRAQWQYDEERKRLGYFESGSRRICDVVECAVLVPELQWVLDDLRAGMMDGSLPRDARYFRAIAGDDSAIFGAGFERAHRSAQKPQPADSLVASIDSENDAITRTIAGEVYQLNDESFFQTNVDLLAQLIDEAIGKAQGETAIELYCGVGLFTVPLGRRFKDVVAVEDDTEATRFARDNLARAGLSNADIERSDVGNWLSWNEHNQRFSALDFLLLDPPRTGAESRVISGILKLRPKRICYVSCDPATLARDLKKLSAGGFSIDSIRAFDMFPQTHHVETVVHLSG